MSVKAEQTKRPGIFYGWWVVVGATIIQALNGGVYYYGFSVFYVPLIKEFGWSSAALSGVFSLSRLESGVAAPVVGFLIDRFGPRTFVIVGFSLVGIGFILISRVNSILMLYIVFVVLLSVGASFGFNLPATSTVARWFVRKRGIALGITACGVGIGGMIALPILGWLIEAFGWRNTAIAIGVLFLASGPPLSLIMRRRPELYGYLPDGNSPERETVEPHHYLGEKKEGKPASGSTSQAASLDAPEITFTPRQALETRAFWVFSLVFALRLMVNTGIGVHLIPSIQNLGYSLSTATLIAGIMSALSIPGRLGFGWLADRFDKRLLIGSCMVMQFLGIMALAFASDLSLIIVFLLIYSLPYGGQAPLTPATWGAYFGRHSFATISGLAQAVTMFGNIAGPLVAGFAFDLTGDYHFAFLFFAAISLVGAVPLLMAGKPQARRAIPASAPSGHLS